MQPSPLKLLRLLKVTGNLRVIPWLCSRFVGTTWGIIFVTGYAWQTVGKQAQNLHVNWFRKNEDGISLRFRDNMRVRLDG